ncbi:flippase-like domain-containing protein [Catenulispora sp. NF23]|uniref:lysylphosphatidylglycerol synthase transmembrane domain-containing protein n=1 Tax=Catenulispora pinistramenti TaxID=2705254 RepID=UPI001BA7046C|nr:lysylphosphatidylglycerol synthase transmembrane domain-containing protein [Catenulispora pinistramenti]MBS2535110.1 flippase-like domain-containing protein [Catenulispora pinistramenti]
MADRSANQLANQSAKADSDTGLTRPGDSAGSVGGTAPPSDIAGSTLPPPPDPHRRVRLPSDRLRLVGTVALAVLLAVAGVVGHRAGCDLRQEILHRAAAFPRFMLNVVQVLAFLSVIGVPVALAIERLVKRENVQVVDAVGAATLSYLAAFSVNVVTSHYEESAAAQAIGGATPMQVQLAVGVAVVTVLGFSRSQYRTLFYTAAAVGGLAVVLLGQDSATGVLLSLLLGRIVATAWLSVRGVLDTRPGIARILAELDRDGFRAHPGSVRVLEPGADGARRFRVAVEETQRADPPESAQHLKQTKQTARAKQAEQTQQTRLTEQAAHTKQHKQLLDLSVLDQSQRAVYLASVVWQWIRLRGPVRRRSFFSLRRTVESEVLMAMAVDAAGIRTPRLRSTRQVDQDTALLAYDHLDAPRLADLPDRAWTPGLHQSVWALWRHLRNRQLAHRELTTDHLRLDPDGRLWLTDVGFGEIAAEDVLCRLDGAELLVSIALRVGPARATEEAVDALGPDTVASLLPLMQPILFSETVTKALRRHRTAGEHPADARPTAGRADVVSAIRDRIVALHPEADDVQPVSLERVRPRTVLSVVGGAIAFYLLATQLTGFQMPKLNTWQAWGWVLGAAVASGLTYVAAAFNLLGCVKERVPVGRTITAQVAAAFAGLVAPAAVGGLAVNTRFLQRAGIPVARAVTAVGVSQVIGFSCYLVLLLLFSAFAGNHQKGSGGLSAITPSATVTGVVIALAVIGLLIAAIPRLRAFVLSRVKPLVTDIGPEVLQVARSPRKVVQAFGGAVGLPMAASVCLWASVNAVSGSDVNLAAMGVAYLVAKAVGSLIPTPGGVGGVEAVLTAGLTAAGVPSAVAATSVIVFRLLTWWLPVIPGWFAFTALQRRGAL